MPDLIAATAACIAAVLSGLSLFVGGRREERRWRREAMTDTLVTFLDASFSGPGQRVYDARSRRDDLSEHRHESELARRTEIDALTRLRLLAPSDVVLAAERLHEAGHQVSSAVFASNGLPSEEEWQQLRLRRRGAREELLDTARKTLGLGPAQAIGR
ncbi:hypothetical protein ACWGID_09240 [Kribbella sp. NPDC054772]